VRHGQSTVETMLAITAVVFALLCVCWFEMEPLLALVNVVAEQIQASSWFDRVAAFLSGSDV